jgi:hypothetical protein
MDIDELIVGIIVLSLMQMVGVEHFLCVFFQVSDAQVGEVRTKVSYRHFLIQRFREDYIWGWEGSHFLTHKPGSGAPPSSSNFTHEFKLQSRRPSPTCPVSLEQSDLSSGWMLALWEVAWGSLMASHFPTVRLPFWLLKFAPGAG